MSDLRKIRRILAEEGLIRQAAAPDPDLSGDLAPYPSVDEIVPLCP